MTTNRFHVKFIAHIFVSLNNSYDSCEYNEFKTHCICILSVVQIDMLINYA